MYTVKEMKTMIEMAYKQGLSRHKDVNKVVVEMDIKQLQGMIMSKLQ